MSVSLTFDQRVEKFYQDHPKFIQGAQRVVVGVLALAAILLITGLITGAIADIKAPGYTPDWVDGHFVHLTPAQLAANWYAANITFPIWYCSMWGSIGMVALTIGVAFHRWRKQRSDESTEKPRGARMGDAVEVERAPLVSRDEVAIGSCSRRLRNIGMVAGVVIAAIGASILLWSSVMHDYSPFADLKASGANVNSLNQALGDMKIVGTSMLFIGAITFGGSYVGVEGLKQLGTRLASWSNKKEIESEGFGNRSHQVDDEQDL